MATVTGLTAERMLEIEAACIIDGAIVLDDLILTRHDGGEINAGRVTGEKGPPLWTPIMTANMDITYGEKNSFQKARDGDGFNASVRSAEGFSQGCFMSFQPDGIMEFYMGGLNTDPASSSNFESIDFCWYITSATAWYVESGVLTLSDVAVTNDMPFSITYDGVNVRYYADGVLKRTVARAPGLPFFFDSTFYQVGAGMRNVSFGPMGKSGVDGAVGPQGPQGATTIGDALQPGVVESDHLAMVRDANLQIRILAGVAWVMSAAGVLTRVVVPETTLALTQAANARLDQIVVSSAGVVSRVQGTNTVGATLNNRNGAAAIPAGSMLLYDILITINGFEVGNYRNRRSWARGAYGRILRTSNAGGTDDYTVAPAAPAMLDANNLAMRMECTGAPLRLRVSGSMACGGSAGSQIGLTFFVDGVLVSPSTAAAGLAYFNSPSAAIPFNVVFDIAPAAGSRLIAVGVATVVSNGIVYARPAMPLQFVVEELVRQNAANNS